MFSKSLPFPPPFSDTVSDQLRPFQTASLPEPPPPLHYKPSAQVVYIYARMALQVRTKTNKMHHPLFPIDPHQHHPRVSDEEFNLFHSIDRELYARLVHNLGRDPVESVQMVAFCMWLERETCHMKLIKRMLSLPHDLLNQVADETGVCLKCVESEMFQCADGYEIRLLRHLLRKQDITLFFFHRHRIEVLRGVAKIISTVCLRAFGDILKPMQKMEMDQVGERVIRDDGGEGKREVPVPMPVPVSVSPDDRTVFLTFSKGYPITEDEVKEFFTRRFGGDLIEDLIMQQVRGDEQVLYAKMVVRRPAVISIIVRGNKAKYSINGKHVWARNYVKRHHTMNQTGESSL